VKRHQFHTAVAIVADTATIRTIVPLMPALMSSDRSLAAGARLHRDAHHPRLFAKPIAWVRNLAQAVAREVAFRRAVRQVAELDDDMLKDVGIQRGGIEGALRFGRQH
jgi:uncharacterized protein YjiS (DUF1127 family)